MDMFSEGTSDAIRGALLFFDSNKKLLWYFICFCISSVILFGVQPLKAKDDEESTIVVLKTIIRRLTLLSIFIFIPLIYLFVYLFSTKLTESDEYFYYFFENTFYGFKGAWALYLAVFFCSVTVKIFTTRILSPYLSYLVRRYRVRQTSVQKSDIRKEVASNKTKNFDPEKYFKDGFMFLGLDENNQPIYESDEDFKKKHLKVVGPSQTGKGVLQGVIIFQAIIKGWCVGFFDIKPDDFIYSIMVKACKKAGRPLPIVVDLNGIGPGSYNMFTNGTRREILTRLHHALRLVETGTNADFYKNRERSLMLDIEKYFDGNLDTLEKLLKGDMPDGSKRPEYFELTEGSRSNVKELRLHKPLNPKKGRGFNVDKTIQSGAVFYIRGSVTDKLVRKAQTIMVMDIIQSVLRMGKQDTHFYLAIDEVKFFVSDMLSTGLSTVLSKGLNISLAYQSPANLLSLEDKTLNAEAIKSEIEINTLTSIIYRAANGKAAEELAKDTGVINKRTVRSEEIEYDKMGAETYTGRKQLQSEQEELISANKLLSLPERVAALLRPTTLSTMLYTSWINVDRLYKTYEFEGYKNPKSDDARDCTEEDAELNEVIISSYSEEQFKREAGL